MAPTLEVDALCENSARRYLFGAASIFLALMALCLIAIIEASPPRWLTIGPPGRVWFTVWLTLRGLLLLGTLIGAAGLLRRASSRLLAGVGITVNFAFLIFLCIA